MQQTHKQHQNSKIPAGFYNPAGKPVHALLSRREKLVGRFLPRLIQVSLFALSVSLTSNVEGPAKAAAAAAFFACTAAYLRRSGIKEFNSAAKNGELYDFTKPRDVLAFRHKYHFHDDLPARYLLITADAGLEKPPLLFVTAKEDSASISRLNFTGAPTQHAVRMGRGFLHGSTPALIAHVCAHEIAHAARNHTNTLEPVATLAAQGMHLKAGAAIALSGNIVGGAIYSVVAIAVSFITQARLARSYEREADRFALVRTGVVDEVLPQFEKAASEGKNNAPVLAVAFKQAEQYLFSVHPRNEDRADYIRAYKSANEDVAAKTRLLIGLRP